METKLKLVFLAPLGYSIPPKKYGGAERVIYYQIKELIKRGHQITLFCYEHDEELDKLGVTVYSGFRKGEQLIVELLARQAWLQEQDVLLDNSPGTLPSRIFHNKILTLSFTHGMGNPGQGYAIPMTEDQKARWKADKLKCSDYVLFNGFDLNDYPRSEEKQGYALFIGKLNEIKGVSYFVELCNKYGIKGKVAGQAHDPHGTGYATKWLKEIEKSPQLEWVGEVGGQEKIDLIQKADCFIFPTIVREACPLAPIEAMLCGTPTATWDIGPMREIVSSGVNGYVSPVMDIVFLYDAYVKCLDLKKENVAKFTSFKFNIYNIINHLETILENLLI